MNDDAVPLALWGVPDDGARSVLRGQISKLALRWDTPPFEPHVTLFLSPSRELMLSPIQLAAITAGISPVSVTFSEIVDSDVFYRCVVLKAELTPQLAAFRDAFAPEAAVDAEPWWPHLSLLYGAMDQARRAEVVAQISLNLPFTCELSSVALVGITDDVAAWPMYGEFRLGAI